MPVLRLLVAEIVRHRTEVLDPTILSVRLRLAAVIVRLYVTSQNPLFLALPGVVAFGTVLTAGGLLADQRSSAQGRRFDG